MMFVRRRVAHVSLVAISFTILVFLHQLVRQNISIFGGQSEWDWIDNSSSISRDKSRWTIPGRSRPIHAPLQSEQLIAQSKMQEVNYSRTLVIPRMSDDDVSWIDQELPNLNVSVYVANDPSSSLHSPKNKGHEVMVYLTYIIDHYDSLPDVVICMHAHQRTHHNNEFLDYDAPQMIKRLSNTHVVRNGYVNLRCHWSPGCPEWLHPGNREEVMGKQEERVLVDTWTEIFPSEPLPTTLAQPCCAQFALSRDRIRSIPLSRFTFFRDWILRTPLNDYVSGRIWEYSWQYLFTNQSVVCPAEHLCYCEAFHLCFGGAEEFGNYKDIQSTKLEYEGRIKALAPDPDPSKVTVLELDNYTYLRRQIDALDKELTSRKQKAMERGESPEERAKECSRQGDEG